MRTRSHLQAAVDPASLADEIDTALAPILSGGHRAALERLMRAFGRRLEALRASHDADLASAEDAVTEALHALYSQRGWWRAERALQRYGRRFQVAPIFVLLDYLDRHGADPFEEPCRSTATTTEIAASQTHQTRPLSEVLRDIRQNGGGLVLRERDDAEVETGGNKTGDVART